MTTIEIEDYNGNTIGSFVIKSNIKHKDIINLSGFDIADEEEDYINNEANLIRIQKINKDFY